MIMSKNYIATPPGAAIKEQLIDRGMSQKEFAARMDLSEKHVSRLINGDVQLTPDVAMRLEMVLGVPASFWNNLEAIYRDRLVKIKDENNMENDILLARKFPYLEMSKLGWVPETRNVKEKVVNLRKYFEVTNLSLLEDELITNIACRRLKMTEKGDLALMAWAQMARLESRKIYSEPINMKKLISIIPEIRNMTVMKPKEFCGILRSLLADCGVVLVFLPHLKGSFLQGATFYEGNKIVIGLTDRGKDADKFWFSLFHELAHIILGHIGQHNGTSEDDERAADKWAEDTMIDYESYKTLCLSNDLSRKEIIHFANEQGVAPGIVVGRLQKDGIIRYDEFNDLKERYEIVA